MRAVTRETPRAVRLHLQADGWEGHRPGQHLDVRLTAPDGYTAQRSYSIASPPERPGVELVVERLDDGEVSAYLTEEVRAGDRIELRGPVGGYFVWPEAPGGPTARRTPVQLVAGGSGVVPFLAMLGHHVATGSVVPLRLLYSARTVEDVIGRHELERGGPGITTTITLTRGAPDGWRGAEGRVDADLLREHTFGPDVAPRVFVCGSTSFVEGVVVQLVALGHDAGGIRTERFGATGGT